MEGGEGRKLHGLAADRQLAAPLVDGCEIGPVQDPVADEVGLGRRQGEQGGELGFGEDAAARHGRTVPLGV